jgi:hypothetical protein
MPHTMGRKESKLWLSQWVRQKIKEKNNGLPPNNPNHNEKPPADVERHLCKCDLDCQSHMSLEHDTYSRRYWSCPLATCPFHSGWDKKKPRKVVSVLYLCCILLIMSSLTVIFSCRVFVLKFSHHHRNRRDVISRNGLMAI